jgi:hypothetical protein
MRKKLIRSSATWIEKYFVKINVGLLVICIIGAFYCSCVTKNEHWVCWEVWALIAIFLFNASLLYTGFSENITWTVAFEKRHRIVILFIPFVLIFASITVALVTIIMRQLYLHLICVFIMSLMFWWIDCLVRYEATIRVKSAEEELTDDLRKRILSIRDTFEKSMFFM